MLIIRSLFYQITIPDTMEYAIYTNDYYVDTEGNVLKETDRGDVYDYGDIIIQTGNAKYFFQRVYAAYDYAVKMMEYIKEHLKDEIIYLNMAELNENWDCHFGSGSFLVEKI